MKHIRVVDDEPIAKVYYKTGEVAAMFGIAPSALRFWETEFEQLKPRRQHKGKDRKYTVEDIEIVNQIHRLLKVDLMTIPGARKRLNLG